MSIRNLKTAMLAAAALLISPPGDLPDSPDRLNDNQPWRRHKNRNKGSSGAIRRRIMGGGLIDPPVKKRKAYKPGRNETCPCGTGKKFKRCCEGRRDVVFTGPAVTTVKI